MLITFKKQKLTIGQLTSGKIKENILYEHEISAVNLIKSWISGQEMFVLKSSGSTGTPKEINLSRTILEYSVHTSMDFLDPEHGFRSALLCISPERVGGMMVLFRAIERNLDLTILPASSGLADLPEGTFDLVSLVPMQIQALLNHSPEKLNQFRTILVGGAALNTHDISRLRKYPHLRVFHTYGMTETASHVALKNISTDQPWFDTLGDLEIRTDSRHCLSIKGTVTQQHWLQTNDVVELRSSNQFLWKGRADFVINSGGVKIHPEMVEGKLQEQFDSPFFIAGIPDERLGEKVILVVEGTENHEPDFSSLDRYEIPKKIYYLPKLMYTQSGKIDRLTTMLNLQ